MSESFNQRNQGGVYLKIGPSTFFLWGRNSKELKQTFLRGNSPWLDRREMGSGRGLRHSFSGFSTTHVPVVGVTVRVYSVGTSTEVHGRLSKEKENL